MLKDDIKKAIDNLPDDCTLEDIQYTLYVRQKIEKGIKDVENGDVVSHTEVEQRFSEWTV
ncbi:MAG: hypothetical protein LRY73_05535 [Bacillus sp. (in: Bacteria)]|nr:hypothetical protein [Bacillus sp. (in: firmicutes)]